MALRDTKYAREIKSVEDSFGARIERLYVKKQGQDEIRFSWWKDGKLIPRPLDHPEVELLPLMQSAIKEGVFKDDFLRSLQAILAEHFHGQG
jgi:hypothetical protein